MRISLLFCFFIFQISAAHSQQVKGQILDSGSKQPIPYANVIFGENKGVVTNEEGFFSFTAEEIPSLQLKISSLGYETLELQPKDITNGIVYLKPASIELKEVFLSNKNLSPREIIEKAKEEIANNYDMGLGQKRVFYRESNFNHIRKFDMQVDESTIPGIDQDLMDRIVKEMPKMTDSYREVLADVYGNYDSQKVRIVKAANLYNPQSTQSLDQLTEHLETLFRQNLKEKSFLKIRSGIIGVKVDSEELQEGLAESDPEKEKTPEELAKKEEKERKYLRESTTKEINSILSNVFWKEDISFNLFEKTGKYEFELQGILHLGENTVYVINFQPKRRADFKGRIYVDAVDYGVHRIEYENVKPLSKFRLFGISTVDDIYRGKMIFVKNATGKYSLSYLEREQGETVGIDRPLTIIEKNRHVPGRNKQNELDLDLDMRFGQVEKVQLVVYEDHPLAGKDYEALEEQGAFEYEKFKQYNPDFWNGYNIIEPNTAIKAFTALETE